MQLKKMGVSVNKIRMKEDAWKANGKYNRRNNTITSLTKRTIVDNTTGEWLLVSQYFHLIGNIETVN